MSTRDLEEEVVSYRVAGTSLLDDDIGQEVVVIDGNGSVIINNQSWAFVRDLLHAVDFIPWNKGQSTSSMRQTVSTFNPSHHFTFKVM